jgi:glycine/D-amino acid oxidase-like deaminating enzyme
MAREPGLDAALWAATASGNGDYPALEGERRADVAIVGGGFTGCSAALHLAQKGVDAVVLEAKEIGWGGSGRNSGFVNAGLWLNPDEVIRRVGAEYGPRLVDAFNTNTELVFALVDKYGIDCDLDRKGVIRGAHSARAMRALEDHVRQWTALGAPIDLLDRGQMVEMLGTDRFAGGLVDHRSSSIQPLSYVRGLARAAAEEGAAIHCGTRVTGLAREGEAWRVSTESGAVVAKSVIAATNAYSDDFWPGLRQSTTSVGCFGYVTEPLGENVRHTVLPAGHSVYSTHTAICFIRLDREHRLVVGSLGYLPGRGWADHMVRWLFPHLDVPRWEHKWAGTIGFTPDHIPRLHEPAPGLHVALGYNGRGIAPGTFWGKALAEWVTGMPASELPLPVTPVRPIPFNGLRVHAYEMAFRAYRLGRFVR